MPWDRYWALIVAAWPEIVDDDDEGNLSVAPSRLKTLLEHAYCTGAKNASDTAMLASIIQKGTDPCVPSSSTSPPSV